MFQEPLFAANVRKKYDVRKVFGVSQANNAFLRAHQNKDSILIQGGVGGIGSTSQPNQITHSGIEPNSNSMGIKLVTTEEATETYYSQ